MKMKVFVLLFFFCVTWSLYGQKLSFSVSGGIDDQRLKQTMEINTNQLLVRINDAFSKKSESIQLDMKTVTEDGEIAIQELWSDDHFRFFGGKIFEQINRRENYFQVRNLPVIIGAKDTVDVVIEYTSDGKINDLFIGLNSHQYKRVMNVTGVIDETRRQKILNFIELMRNYYIRKDIDNIKQLYSDKALIIVGKVLHNTGIPVDKVQTTLTQQEVRFQVESKEEYIKGLSKIFATTKYLMLNFDSLSVIKHRKNPNFYGVLLQQSWQTSDYSDKGWLFLLVQFKDNEQPLIWVRTWQDMKDTPENAVFGFHNIIIPDKGQVKL